MAWLACDKDGSEYIYNKEPERDYDEFAPYKYDEDVHDDCVVLPKGSIKKLIGRGLSWSDNPVEIK